jgi:hypothetical protein
MHFSGLLLAVENNRESQRRQWLFSDRAFEIVFAHSKHTYVYHASGLTIVGILRTRAHVESEGVDEAVAVGDATLSFPLYCSAKACNLHILCTMVHSRVLLLYSHDMIFIMELIPIIRHVVHYLLLALDYITKCRHQKL